jgi:acid phosphatase (class A)
MPKRNFGFAAMLALAACATSEPAPVASAQTPPAAASAQVDTTVFVPPPPTANGALEVAELAIVHGPWTEARRAQALEDNAIDPFAAFDAVLGPEFNGASLPATTALLTRVARASGLAGEAAKAVYRRPRPFLADNSITTCIPADDRLRASFSYPSGHGALGFGWALVLAELIPSRGDAIIDRGRDFGVSRVVCGLHYPSDIDAGRVVAAAAVARLHTDPQFQQEMEAARAELSRIYH